MAAIAIPYPELKQWVAQGDTVVALIQTHVGAALDAISAKNDIFFAEYELVLESDKVMYDFISWHAVAYANLLSLRSGIDGLINAFDHDSDVGFGLHYFRKFTGHANAERIARELKKAVDGVPAKMRKPVGLSPDRHSAHPSIYLAADHRYQRANSCHPRDNHGADPGRGDATG